MLSNAEIPPKTRYERHLAHKFLEAERLSALTEVSRDLFLRLCVLRRGLARDANIPAYQVLSNRILLALCEQRPQDLFGLIAIPGFGQVRLRAYGAEVLAVLRGTAAATGGSEEAAGGESVGA